MINKTLPAADLTRHLEVSTTGEVDLLDIPAHRRSLAPIHPEATLQAGLKTIDRLSVKQDIRVGEAQSDYKNANPCMATASS